MQLEAQWHCKIIFVIALNQSRRTGWVWHLARTRKMRNAYNIFVGKPKGKRTLGRKRQKWECNIRMDLRETGWEGVDWMHLAQDRDQCRAVVNTVMDLWVP
jgi:hypothetical protein